MWDAPGRRRDNEPTGDALGGTPDDTRPTNPWPRLLAFAGVVLIMVVLAATCVVSYADPPDRELRARVTEFTLGVPRFVPVTTFGADAGGHTYGAWVTVTARNEATAVLSRNPDTLCHVRWDAGAGAGTGQPGALVDPCGPARFAADGSALASSPRDLHRFPVRFDGEVVTVNLTTITLGTCRTDAATGCSNPGQPEVRTVPQTGLPGR